MTTAFATPGINRLLHILLHTFRDYLEGIEPRGLQHEFSHPGLNNRYGLELEFLASSNRYVIGHRVNSCMWNQNSEWWRRNFNALERLLEDLPSGPRPLTNDHNNFNEWSSFFLEVSENHGSVSHRGDHRCASRGNGSSRIEDDASVELDPRINGITLYSNRAMDNYRITDLRDDNPAWGPLARGLRDAYCRSHYFHGGSDHTLLYDNQWNIPDNPETTLKLYERNELVSGVLTNTYVNYPHTANKDVPYDVEPFPDNGVLPVGSLLIDNLVNHMTSHKVVIGIQEAGFHVHISEFPRIADEETRARCIIGFVKLFYLFEPLFYSFQPFYRSISTWCQSIQSVFTFDEIRNRPWIDIWNDLVYNVPISGVNRKERGERYLSINLTNCQPGGIGTVEIRIGHSTFSSSKIQAYINVIQSLFSFNIAIFNTFPDFTAHHWIMNTFKEIIPIYCEQSSAYYNIRPAVGMISPFNVGRPIYGFFTSTHLDARQKVDFIISLIRIFYKLTGCDAIRYLIPSINYFYGPADTWITRHLLDRYINWNDDIIRPVIDIDHGIYVAMAAQAAALVTGASENDALQIYHKTLQNEGLMDVHINYAFNKFNALSLGDDYSLNADGKSDTIHRCKTCSNHAEGDCSLDFNDGISPEYQRKLDIARDHRDQRLLYAQECGDGRRIRSKIQTELINNKLSEGTYTGGGRKKASTKKGNRKQTGGRHKTRKTNLNIEINKITQTIPKYTNTRNTNNNTRKIHKKIEINKTNTKNTNTHNTYKTSKMNTSKSIPLKPEEIQSMAIHTMNRSYKVNKGAERIVITENEKDGLVVNYCDWLGGLTPSEKLTAVINELLKNKIVDREMLTILENNRYIDAYVYIMDTDIHLTNLYNELDKLNIKKDTVDQIRTIYKKFY